MRIRKNLLISSIIIVIITVPLAPYFNSDGFSFNFGYPFPYFTIYNLEPIRKNEILLSRVLINPLVFFMDIVLVYLFFILGVFIINKLKNKMIQKI